MQFTGYQVAVDLKQFAYTLIGAGLGVIIIISLIAMTLFIFAQLK